MVIGFSMAFHFAVYAAELEHHSNTHFTRFQSDNSAFGAGYVVDR